MNNNNKNNDEQNPNSKENEEIPLWLQGLEDSDEENTTPGNTEPKDPADAWEKEIIEESDDKNLIQPDPSAVNSENAPLPDWLNELSDLDSKPPLKTTIKDNMETDQEEEEIEDDIFDASETANPPYTALPSEGDKKQTLSDPIDEPLPEEGFVEISDLSLQDKPSEGNENPEIALEDKPIPDWLQEIVEDSQSITENKKIPSPEITQQQPDEINLTLADSDETVADEEEIISKIPKDFLDSEIADAISPLEGVPSIYEDDTAPINVDSLSHDSDEEQPDTSKEQEIGSDVMPDSLLLAKTHLDQKEVDEALKLINVHIEEGSYLPEIESWFLEFIKENTSTNSQIWESLGDTALKQKKLDQAINAYAKAINFLIQKNEDINEAN